MAECARILVVEDHALVRDGLKLLLNSQADLEVVAEAADGQIAIPLVEEFQPDLVLLDINMPNLNGLQTARFIHENFPGVSTLILTMHDHLDFFFEAIQAGASGYILKKASGKDLLHAIRAVLNGDVYLPPHLAKVLVEQQRQHPAVSKFKDHGYDSLSNREKEILLAIAQGLSAREIADQMVISPSTVQSHRTNILEKLSLNTTADLVRYAVRIGLIEP